MAFVTKPALLPEDFGLPTANKTLDIPKKPKKKSSKKPSSAKSTKKSTKSPKKSTKSPKTPKAAQRKLPWK